MTKTKQTSRKHPLLANPFRRNLVTMDHPAASVVELILTQASNQLEENENENKHPNRAGGRSGTFPGTGLES